MRLFAFALVAALVPTAASSQDCGLLAQGLYDTSARTNDVNRALSFKHNFCSRQFQNSSGAKSFALSLGITDLADLGLSNDESNWSKSYAEFCNDTVYLDKYAIKTQEVINRVNGKVVDALKACLTQEGLHVWYQTSSDRNKFIIRAHYTPEANVFTRPRLSITPDNATCMDLPVGEFTLRIGEFNKLCTRRTGGVARVAINADRKVHEGGVFELPYDAPTVTPPPQPSAVWDTFTRENVIYKLSIPYVGQDNWIELKRESEKWIITTCRPNTINDVQGLIHQGGLKPFNLFTYCRKGQGRLKNVRLEIIPWSGGYGVSDAIKSSPRGFSLISFIDTREGQSVIIAFPGD